MAANNMKQRENNYADCYMTHMAPHAFITKLLRNYLENHCIPLSCG